MARLIETDSYTNKDISSAVAIGAYTANATRLVHVRVAVDQAAGGGDYVIYVTLQIGSAGSSYVVIPKTTATAAAGETALMFVGGPIPVDNTDILTVMLDGLAGDTTTPDIKVSFYEHNYLAPATVDRTLTVAATGEASANVTHSAGVAVSGRLAEYADLASLALETTAQAILTDTGTTLPALISATGSGVWTIEITVNNGTTVLENAKVQLSEGANRFVGETNESGVVTFNVDAATYIVAIAKTGYSYSGTTLVVSDDVSITYSMSINSFTSSLPGQSTGWVYCYNYNGDIEASVTIYVQQVATTETSGYAFDTTIYTLTSDENGLVEATGLWIGATYQAKRVNGAWHSFVVPDAATFALPAMLGR